MGNGETRNLACPYSTYPGKGRRDGVWTGNRGVTKASPASGSTKAQEGTARLGVKEGVKPEVCGFYSVLLMFPHQRKCQSFSQKVVPMVEVRFSLPSRLLMCVLGHIPGPRFNTCYCSEIGVNFWARHNTKQRQSGAAQPSSGCGYAGGASCDDGGGPWRHTTARRTKDQWRRRASTNREEDRTGKEEEEDDSAHRRRRTARRRSGEGGAWLGRSAARSAPSRGGGVRARAVQRRAALTQVFKPNSEEQPQSVADLSTKPQVLTPSQRRSFPKSSPKFLVGLSKASGTLL
uniref:Uncharacterized protein n=1 Tax=Oryza brachyantha TaxID=4533 RepID=J3M5Y3_ORYBR